MINTDKLFDIFDNDDRIVDVREITDGEMYDIICENKKIANQVADMLNSRLGTVAFGFMKTGSGGYYRFTIIPRDYDEKKSLKESEENFVNYIAVYNEDGDCRGYVQNESSKLTQDVEKALHFKNENEANKFISNLLKRGTFSSDDLYVEGVYLNESKKSARKSLNESKIDKGRVTYEFTCLLNNLGLSGIDYSNDENNEKRDEIIDMIIDLAKTMPRL
jgi:hypothetical protein